jgi:hypothetical protein
METKKIEYEGAKIQVYKYEPADVPVILQPFLLWYTSAIISEDYGFRKPPIPEDFTEKISCYILGYWHKYGAGVDAFEIIDDKINLIEIKGTTTDTGFQGNINEEYFDALIWFDFSGYKKLEYKIFKLAKELFIGHNVKLNLKTIVSVHNIAPICIGKIGLINNLQ